MIDAGLSHLGCVEAMRAKILEGIPMGRYGALTLLSALPDCPIFTP